MITGPITLIGVLPHVNAVLNTVSTILLIIGFSLIRI